MAEILAQWLNEEVGLSRRVTDFEEDFSSGYLFGELLWKFNQQADFEEFSKKDAISHRLQNFEKLEPSLRNLNIKFDSKMVDKVMKRERGLALRLLYQLKMCLEKVYPTTDIAVLTKTGQFGDNQPAQKIANSKEKYDRVQHQFFKTRINALNKPQKQLNMEAHLQKFEEEKETQADFAARCDSEDKQVAAMRKQEMRRIQINKLQRNAGFMEEWHQKGVEDWKKNQKRQRDRESKQLEFDLKQAQKFNVVAEKKLQDAKDEVVDGIDQFEHTLTQNGINPRVQRDVADRAITDSFNAKSGAPGIRAARSIGAGGTLTKSGTMGAGAAGLAMTTKTGAFTLESTGLKQRTKKTLTEATRKQREKRRRRLIGQQEENMKELELKKRESMVTELIKHQSNQEKELDYEVWRTNQCKEVIAKNRQLRESQYERRRELDKELAQGKEQEMLKTMQEATKRVVQERIVRSSEMQAYESAQKTTNHSQLCAGLLDQIIDIADEAYNHQQRNDSQEIDSRNWHEWVQLFLHDMPITGTLDSLASLIPQEDAGENMVEKEAEIDASNLKLDELELVDYLKNLGQWTSDIVAKSKPKLDEILNPPADVDAKGKAKAPAKGAPAEVTFDEAELEISNAPDNNFLLGDALEQIIKINFAERARLKHPQNPNWLSVKICLAGYPFAGKKEQAERISKKYNLDVFNMEALVQEAIDFAAEHPDPIDAPAKPEASEKEENKGEGEKEDAKAEDSLSDLCMSEDEDQEFNLQEDFRQCGLQMSQLLLDGEEISDNLYVKAFETKLRIQYPYKDPKTKQKELKEQAKRQVEIKERMRAIQDELQQEDLKKKQIKLLETEQSNLQEEQDDLMATEAMGWVLVDFPCNYAQAKLLEEAMSGFKPTAELDPITRDTEMEDAFLLVQPTAKEEPPKLLIKSGLDAVIWFKCPLKECQRRADGRRLDVEELSKSAQTFYHVDDEAPPMDCAPLCERLEPIDEDRNHTSALVDRVVSFDQQERSLRKWLTAFGVEERQYNLLQEIDADSAKEDVTEQISKVIANILDNKQTEKESMRELFIMKIRQMMDEKQKQTVADAVSGINEGDKSIEDADLNKTGEMSKLSNREKGEDTNRKSKDQSVLDKQPVDASLDAMAKSALSSVLSSGAAQQMPDRDNIDSDFKPVIIELWRDLAKNYKSQMKRVFRNIRLQREQASIHNSSLKMQFLEFLHTSDGKQDILDEYVKNFNEFSDQYPDLREDDQTKEELHQRTDALSDELWEIVEERKEQAVEFRKKVMESGFVEFNLEFLTQIAQQLMQAEVDKFKTQVQITQDYYHAVEEKLIPEAPPASAVEIGFPEGEEPPAVENLPEGADSTKIESYAYPRLDRLLAMAVKQQVVPDVTQVQAAADPKKGGGKKDAKKGQPAAEEEKAIEESIYVKEMREAIKVEKSIYRYRLVQVRNWALNQLKGMRQSSLDLYKMLEDWIFVAQKTEMDAIEEMCMVIKDSIEEETKIQSELRIKFMDFTVDQGVLNYITPPPPKHEALEEQTTTRFTIPQIQSTINEFQVFDRISGTSGKVRVQFLYQFFKSRVSSSQNFQGFRSTLPEVWNTMGMDSFMALIRNLDPQSTGWIDWRHLMTYFILLQSPVLDLQEAAKIQVLADGEGYISKEAFVGAALWFEATEGSKDRHYHLPFERKRFIKEELFRVNAEPVEGKDEPQVSAGALVRTLTAPHGAKGVKTYNDFIFAPTIGGQK